MKNLRNAVLMLLAAIALQTCNKASFKSEKMKTRTDSASYMLGVYYGNTLKRSKMEDINAHFFAKGVEDVIKNDSMPVSPHEINTFLNNYFAERQMDMEKKNKEEGEAFLKENKTKPGVIETASGLQYKVIQEGTGKSPQMGDTVICQYTGKLIDGKTFGSSYEGGQPAKFLLSSTGLIHGWQEGLQLMKEGGKYELYVPSQLAYGVQGRGQDIEPNSVLIFDIELLEVTPGKGSGK